MATMTVLDLIDKAKRKQGFAADNKLAISMNLARQHVSNWRTRKAAPEPHAAVLLARLADVSPLVAIAVCELSREKDPRKRRDWHRLISDAKTEAKSAEVARSAINGDEIEP